MRTPTAASANASPRSSARSRSWRPSSSWLRDGDDRFRAVFDNAAIGIRLADVADEGRLLEANEAFHRLLGYEPGELIGATVFDITHPEDVPENRRLFREVAAGEQPSFQMEKRYLRRDGSEMWGRLTASPLRDATRRRRRDDRAARGHHRPQAGRGAAAGGDGAQPRPARQRGRRHRHDRRSRGSSRRSTPRSSGCSATAPRSSSGRTSRSSCRSRTATSTTATSSATARTGERRIIGIGREVEARRKDGTDLPHRSGGQRGVVGGVRIVHGHHPRHDASQGGRGGDPPPARLRRERHRHRTGHRPGARRRRARGALQPLHRAAARGAARRGGRQELDRDLRPERLREDIQSQFARIGRRGARERRADAHPRRPMEPSG